MGRKKKPEPKPDPHGRVTIVNLKGSMEQREWLDHIARETMIPASRIVRAALSAWAKKRGYPPMPGMEDH
jgi:hypothetical protein